MARTDDRNSDGARASSATAAHLQGTRRANPLNYIPGFFYVLVFFIVGKLIFADPRATLVQWGEYHLSWVEVLLVGAAMMAMAEQLRVSHAGIDNTIEAILVGAIAGIQVLLFALGAAGVRPLAIFNNTEFLMLHCDQHDTGRRCDLDQRQDATADDRCRRQRLVQEEPICDDCLMAFWEDCVVGPKPDNVVQVPAKAKSGPSNLRPRRT